MHASPFFKDKWCVGWKGLNCDIFNPKCATLAANSNIGHLCIFKVGNSFPLTAEATWSKVDIKLIYSKVSFSQRKQWVQDLSRMCKNSSCSESIGSSAVWINHSLALSSIPWPRGVRGSKYHPRIAPACYLQSPTCCALQRIAVRRNAASRVNSQYGDTVCCGVRGEEEPANELHMDQWRCEG